MTLEEASFEPGLEIFRNLRAEDEWEISRLGDSCALLTELVNCPGACLARVGGIPACIYGCAPGRGGTSPARLWLVTTPLVEKAWVHLARMGYEYVQRKLREHGVIECYVVPRNARARRWVEWMGFRGREVELEIGTVLHYMKRL